MHWKAQDQLKERTVVPWQLQFNSISWINNKHEKAVTEDIYSASAYVESHFSGRSLSPTYSDNNKKHNWQFNSGTDVIHAGV